MIRSAALLIALAWAGSAPAATFYRNDFDAPPDNSQAVCFSPGVELPPRPGGTGTRSLRFPYPAGSNMTHEEHCTFAQPHRDVYMRYWLRVPPNFRHLWQPCCGGNNKLFAIWMDGYSHKGAGSTVVWEFWPSEAEPLGGSDLAVHNSDGNFTPAGPHRQFMPFIRYPEDQGRWMEIVLHVRTATSATSFDGVIELWRRWSGEAAFTRLHEIRDAKLVMPPQGPAGWKRLYTMGWSNPGYLVDTAFYIDDVEISNTPFADVEASAVLFGNGFEAP